MPRAGDLAIVPFGQHFGQLARRFGPQGAQAIAAGALALIGGESGRQLALTVGREGLRHAYQLVKQYGGRAIEKWMKSPDKRPVDRPVQKERTKEVIPVGRPYLLKNIDRELNAVVRNDNPDQDPVLVNCINAVALGDGPGQRNGRQIFLKSIHLQGTVTSVGQTDNSHNSYLVLVALVLDTQTNRLTWTPNDVYGPLSIALNEALNFRSIAFTHRYKVLWSKRFELNSRGLAYNGTAIVTPGYSRHFEVNLDVDITTNFAADEADVESITDNSIHVLAIGNDATNSRLQIAYVSRVRYYNK